MVSFKNSLVLLIILSALIEEFSEFPVDEETLLPEQPLKTKAQVQDIISFTCPFSLLKSLDQQQTRQ